MLLRLLTPEGIITESEAKELLLPTLGGELGVMDGHASLIMPLLDGVLRIKDGAQWKTGTGTVEISSHTVTALVISAEAF